MKSVHTEAYHRLFAQLPQDVQKQASKADRLFKENPNYPSLQFKCVDKERSWYSVRVNKSYRVVGIKEGDMIIWFFIGSHTDYDRLLK